MQTLFISDLHLSAVSADIRSCFLRFLQNNAKPKQTEALYILGDLFEVWVGDDDNSPWIEEIREKLNYLSVSGVKIYLMQGNRDFLLGQSFATECGAILLADPVVIDLYGTLTLLTHGDLLCTEDHSYQTWRKFAHNKLIQKFFLSLPLRWRQRIADKLRNKSQAYTKKLAINKINNIDNIDKMDVNINSLEKWISHYQVKQIIHGHTHRPAVHKTETYTRFVLPAWHPEGGMLIAKPNSELELIVK